MQNSLNKDKLLLWWLPVAVAIIGCIASFYCWRWLNNREREFVRHVAHSDVNGVADKSARLMNERIFALQRAAERWIMRDGTPKEEWLADMRNHLKHNPILQVIEWVDTSFSVRWIASLEENAQPQDLDIPLDVNLLTAMEEAKKLNKISVTRTVDLIQGEKGCMICLPLYVKERFDGFILGVLNYRKFFKAHIPTAIASLYSIAVYEGDVQIYSLNASDYPDTTGLQQSTAIEFYGKKWRFEAVPLPGCFSQLHSRKNDVFLPIGVAITFLMAITIFLYRKKRRSEKILTHSEEGLRIAQGIAHIGSWDWNIVDNSEVWSDEQFRIFGYEPGMVAANYDLFLNALHPEDKERVLKSVHDALYNKVPYQVEFRIVRPTQEVRMVYAQGTVYRNSVGKPVRMIGTLQDVTDRKCLEDEIRAIAKLPSENPNPMVRLSHDGKILFSNKEGLFVLESGCCPANQPCKIGDIVTGKWLEYIHKALETDANFKVEEVISKHIYTLTFVPIADQKYVNVYGADITARKHAEEALTISERRYRTLSEASPVGVFYTDIEGRWVYVNKQVSTITGLHAIEAIGEGWMRTLHPEDRQRVSHKWLNSIKEKTGFSSQYRVVKPTGETVWMYGQAMPEKDDAGTVVGYVGTVMDITQLKQTEEKLNKITESAFDAIIAIDENGLISCWNSAAETMFGYMKDEAVGKDVHKLIVPEGFTEKCQHAMKMFKVAGKGELLGKKIVLPARKKDGTQFYAEHSFAAYQSNHRWNAVSIIRDCTERKQYENELKRLNETLEQRVAEKTNEALRKNEELIILTRAVEQSSTCIMITDANGAIEYVNPQFFKLTGYSLEEAKGQNPRILQSGETPSERYKELWSAITTGETWHGEFINKKKDGELYYELASISPIKNAEGEITHIVAIKNNVSEIKKVEAERRRLEEHLYHAQKLESIGKLAGGVAHDFNNMLMAIVGYSNLIEMELEENSHLRNYTKKILDLTENSKRLTRSLLAFGRRQPLYLGTTDLNDVIRDMEPLIFKAIGERIRCEMSLNRNGVTTKADTNKLEQVIMNLVMNAVDAMPDGGRLTIRTDVVELDEAHAKFIGFGAAGSYALLSVSDTGIGMDEVMREKIFEPFFTTKVSGKGAGLGLAIAYGIVRQHNGAIEVVSKPGNGTTFNIYLPLTSEKLKKSVAELSLLSPVTSPLLSKTILVAEDEEGVRETITMMLKQKGFRVIAAVDGEDAVHKFEINKDRVDMLLLDSMMPVKNGKEAYDVIKKMKPDIKALFMSGYSVDEEANKDIQEEYLRFLLKPVSLQALLEAIRKTLDA